MGNWSKRATNAGGVGRTTDAAARRPVGELEAENSRLRRELAEAKLYVEILRKAAVYFAKGSQ
jgi:transposase